MWRGPGSVLPTEYPILGHKNKLQDEKETLQKTLPKKFNLIFQHFHGIIVFRTITVRNFNKVQTLDQVFPMAESKQAESIEYSIVVHNHPKNIKDGASETEKLDTMTNMEEAFKKAEGLAASGDYQKVEVKKKYFEEKTQRNLDMTLKVFENRQKKEIGVVTLTIIAVLCGAIAFGGAFLFGQMAGG